MITEIQEIFLNLHLYRKTKRMKQPLISIITVTYNAEATLPVTLRSVASQTCSDYEQIIIDGASRDATLSVARSLSPESCIISEPDQGLYYAMNKGLRRARGKYVIFLNAGDSFYSNDTLEQYANAARRSEPDIIYSDTVIVDGEGTVLGPRHLSVPERLTKESFSHGMLICHQAFMVSRNIVPAFDTNFRFSADYDWTIKCIDATIPSRCVNLHTVGIRFLTAGTTDRNKVKSLRERYRIMTKHYGHSTTFIRHLSFIPRMMRRKFNTFL